MEHSDIVPAHSREDVELHAADVAPPIAPLIGTTRHVGDAAITVASSDLT